jgi:hypothetical protein
VNTQFQIPTSSRNPIAASFGAGVNRPQVIPDKRVRRRMKSRDRWFEFEG